MQKKTDRNQITKFLCLVVTGSNDTYDKFNLGLQAFEVFETFKILARAPSNQVPGLKKNKLRSDSTR